MATLISYALPSEFMLLFEQPDLYHALTPREQDIVKAYALSAAMNGSQDAGLLALADVIDDAAIFAALYL